MKNEENFLIWSAGSLEFFRGPQPHGDEHPPPKKKKELTLEKSKMCPRKERVGGNNIFSGAKDPSNFPDLFSLCGQDRPCKTQPWHRAVDGTEHARNKSNMS